MSLTVLDVFKFYSGHKIPIQLIHERHAFVIGKIRYLIQSNILFTNKVALIN